MRIRIAVIAFTGMLTGAAAGAEEAPFARLLGGTGPVTLNGASLRPGDAITQEGTVETGAGGRARILLTASKAVISVAPGAKLELKKPAADGGEEHVLQEGIARAKVEKGRTARFLMRSKAATMGVRGTDFMAVSSSLLGESEIIVFEGEVDFESIANAKDRKRITQGHWGGVGGRFGAKIGKPIKLPANVLSEFDRITTVPEN
jgi:hypothetical protein